MGKNTLGEIIYQLRKKAGLTQEDLSEGICSPISISRIENGKQMPSSKVLERILERLGTSTYQLCNVYFENEYQEDLNQTLSEIEAMISAEDFDSARKALQNLPMNKMDAGSFQRTKMLHVAICMKENTNDQNPEDELMDSLKLTKPEIDLFHCRDELFSPTEINILVMITTAKYMADKNLEAIRLGEEVMFALERSQSRLLDFDILQINLAHNLSQILRSENRYQEALTYAKKAEELSLQGTEQFMLPEIEFGIAQILNDLGEREDCCRRIEALIPYMRLIKKDQMADLAQEYLDENSLSELIK